jgi:hypothetical protein
MSYCKSIDEGFSALIPNPKGIPVNKECSSEIRKEHKRWKEEVEQIKKEKSIEQLSYWRVVSSCAAL